MKIIFQFVLRSGVFTTADIQKGNFIVDYTGDIIIGKEGEKILNLKDVATYLFFFKDKASKLVWSVFFICLY